MVHEYADLPGTMTVVVAREPGAPDVLQTEVRDVPKPGYGEVLIKVAAAGINGADLTQRRGKYAVPLGAPDVLGLEVAGTIVALGEGVSSWKVGDVTCALLIGGGYSEYCAVPEVQCLPIPDGLSIEQAASLPEVMCTVWSNVIEIGRLRAGDAFLVHGGASGIGNAAIQLASTLGAQVYATAGSDDKCAYCEEIGAKRAINYKSDDFAEVVLHETGGRGVDVILDVVGGDYLQKGLTAMAPGGRLVMLAFKKEAVVELNCGLIQSKGLWLTGSRLRPRPIAEKGRLVAEVRRAVWPLIEAGRVKTRIDSVYPFSAASEAHAHMEAGRHIGKVLLTPA